jgi:hypothetical protein
MPAEASTHAIVAAIATPNFRTVYEQMPEDRKVKVYPVLSTALMTESRYIYGKSVGKEIKRLLDVPATGHADNNALLSMFTSGSLFEKGPQGFRYPAEKGQLPTSPNWHNVIELQSVDNNIVFVPIPDEDTGVIVSPAAAKLREDLIQRLNRKFSKQLTTLSKGISNLTEENNISLTQKQMIATLNSTSTAE